VDTTTAKPLRKGHDLELAAGELEGGHLALIAYYADENAYQLITTLATGVSTNERVHQVDSSNIPLFGQSMTPTFVHGFAAVPAFVHGSLRCLSTEHGYDPFDEIDIASVIMVQGQDQVPAFVITRDATEVRVRRYNLDVVLSSLHHDTGALVTLDPLKWSIKLYARKYP
jgi:hypothetical protein